MNHPAMDRSTATRILNGLYIIIVVLFFLDAARLVEIKSQFLKSFVYYGFMVFSPVILFWNAFAITGRGHKLIAVIVPVCATALIIAVNPLKIAFSTGVWSTQTILYKNGHLGFKTIEYQIQDVGGAGYNSRTVEVLYLTKLFMITHPVPENINPGIEWIKTDSDANESRLK